MSLKVHGDIVEKEKDLFFAEVKDPVDVKRNLLEAQKDIIEGLQRYENIKFLREKKLENINKLRSTIKELLKLISNLKAALPQAKIREAVKIKKKTKVAKKKAAKKKAKEIAEEKEAKKPMTELEKLESELSAIEGKLGSLK